MLGELFGGVFDGLRGAAYLMTRPRLWKWVLAPALVAAVVLTLVIIWLLGVVGGPIAAIAAFLPGHWDDNFLRLAAGIVLVVASVTIFISFAALIAAPFNEMLSESVEEEVTGVKSPRFKLLRFLGDLVIGMVHAARRVSIYLVVMLALLLLGVVVPVVGPIVATVLGAIATARFASYDAYDAVWARARWRYRAKVAYLREHRWRTLGLGAVVGVFLLVPGLNLIGLSIGATAATLRMNDNGRNAPNAERAAV